MDIPDFKFVALAFEQVKTGDLTGYWVMVQDPEVYESLEDVRQMFRPPDGSTHIVYEMKELYRG